VTGIERIQCAVAHRESDVVPYDPYGSPGHALRTRVAQTDQETMEKARTDFKSVKQNT